MAGALGSSPGLYVWALKRDQGKLRQRKYTPDRRQIFEGNKAIEN